MYFEKRNKFYLVNVYLLGTNCSTISATQTKSNQKINNKYNNTKNTIKLTNSLH